VKLILPYVVKSITVYLLITYLTWFV